MPIWINFVIVIFFQSSTLNILTLHDILYQNQQQAAGGRLNKKDGLTRYGDSHVKDKTS